MFSFKNKNVFSLNLKFVKKLSFGKRDSLGHVTFYIAMI